MLSNIGNKIKHNELKNNKINMVNRNKGFSLVELIVVIAIMAILTTAAAMSIASIFGVAVKQCARDIKSSINDTRVSTMGKDQVILTIKKGNSDGSSDAYYCITTEKDGFGNATTEESRVGRSNLDITYILTDDSGNNSAEQKLDATHPITIEFNRGSGSLKLGSDGKYCTQIRIKKNSTEKILKLYPETGKVSME
ncbi:pilus assembly FimT family protein [Agathobacter sp.]